jgi:hypothetical protein
MYYLLIAAAMAGIGYYYRKDIEKSYNDFRDLNSLVETRGGGTWHVLRVSVEMVFKKWWYELVHWMDNSIHHIDKHRSILTYHLNGRLYKIVLDHRKGPALVLLVTDENEEDVTDIVVPFLGPKRDWHKREFTPEFWGRKQLSFDLSTGENKTFLNQEVIILN